LMGTAFYMSPEQLTNPKGVDHRSDIWALGVILYELLAGRPPFLGESVPEIIGAILTNEPEGLRTLRAEVPFGLEVVIAKCMQSKAVNRHQNVAELAAALGPYAHVRDRSSVDITARVLGEPVNPSATSSPDLGKATLLVPVSAVEQQKQTTNTAASPARAAEISPSTPPPSAPSSAQQVPSVPPASVGPAVGAVTTHGMSTSQITTKPKRTPMPLIAAAVGIVVVLGAAAAGMKLAGGKAKNEGPPVAATGLVAPPQQAEPTAPATAAAAPNASSGSTTILPATNAPASAASPVATNPRPAMGAVATPPSAAASPVAVTPRNVVPLAPAKSAAPVASAAPAAPASATPPAATPVAAPAASASKNPLQMGIK
jgi:hypothetical protein